MNTSSYIHALDGRLRVKIPELKNSEANCRALEASIQRMKGVTWIKANPLTGNVLVFFDSHAITHSRIMTGLRNLGYLKSGWRSRRAGFATSATTKMLTELIVKTAVETAVRSLILSMV